MHVNFDCFSKGIVEELCNEEPDLRIYIDNTQDIFAQEIL
jgi:hypothetical protein